MDKIVVQNLSYKYPTAKGLVLKDVSFKVKEGELCAIIGPNGAGKTTICNAIRGFVPHFYKGEISGDVFVNAKSVGKSNLGELALEIGFLFQNPFTQISGIANTVYEELAFGLGNMGIEPKIIKKKVAEVMKLTEIEHLADSNPFELSGGQQQKVALASMIVMDADIMVLDEPTSQLDPKSTEEIFGIIKLEKDRGKTIVLVEHKIELIAEYADHAILIDGGSVAMDGPVEEVLTDENVLSHKTSLPHYSLLGLEMVKKGVKLNKIPYTLEMAKREMSLFTRQHK